MKLQSTKDKERVLRAARKKPLTVVETWNRWMIHCSVLLTFQNMFTCTQIHMHTRIQRQIVVVDEPEREIIAKSMCAAAALSSVHQALC